MCFSIFYDASYNPECTISQQNDSSIFSNQKKKKKKKRKKKKERERIQYKNRMNERSQLLQIIMREREREREISKRTKIQRISGREKRRARREARNK